MMIQTHKWIHSFKTYRSLIKIILHCLCTHPSCSSLVSFFRTDMSRLVCRRQKIECFKSRITACREAKTKLDKTGNKSCSIVRHFNFWIQGLSASSTGASWGQVVSCIRDVVYCNTDCLVNKSVMLLSSSSCDLTLVSFFFSFLVAMTRHLVLILMTQPQADKPLLLMRTPPSQITWSVRD